MSNINPFLHIEPSRLLEYPFIVPTEKWIRVYIADTLIAESYSPLLLLENDGRELVYFFEKSTVNTQYFNNSEFTGRKNMFKYWHIKIGDKQITNVAYTYNEKAEGELRKLIEYIGFKWNAISKILEEDVELIGHPRNPFHRIDTRPTSRLIQFKIGNKVIAESKHSIALFETDYRVRYYIPADDVKTELLEKTKTTSICPYKGIASYWNIKLHDQIYKEIVWSYEDPDQDALPVKGYYCFWKDAELIVNGESKGKY